MYIVTVEFLVWPKHVEAFHLAVQQQSRNTLTLETGCHQFDVCVDPQNRERIFLYEAYTDEAAFKTHLASDHYAHFDTTVREWIKSKAVQFWHRLQT